MNDVRRDVDRVQLDDVRFLTAGRGSEHRSVLIRSCEEVSDNLGFLSVISRAHPIGACNHMEVALCFEPASRIGENFFGTPPTDDA